jgi:hypothetical protein
MRQYKVPLNRPGWILNDLVSAPLVWVLIWMITVKFWSLDIYQWLSKQHWAVAVPQWNWVPGWAKMSLAQFYAIHFYLILAASAFVLMIMFSWNDKVPGVGRQLFIMWRSWKVNRVLIPKAAKKLVKTENPVFPPRFSKTNDVYLKESKVQRTGDDRGVILGFVKRFKQDIDFERRFNEKVVQATEFSAFVMTIAARLRHSLVTGGSGSGKSASALAQFIQWDATQEDIATVCLNPKGDDYLLRVCTEKTLERRKSPEWEDLLVEYQDALEKGEKRPLHIWALQEKRLRVKPFAYLSIANPDISLGYNPLRFGDPDQVTKKIIYSADSIGGNAFYLGEQQTWLIELINLIQTDADLNGRISLEHIHWFATNPKKRMMNALGHLFQVEPEEKFPWLKEKILATMAYSKLVEGGKNEEIDAFDKSTLLTPEEEQVLLDFENNCVRFENLRQKDPENLAGLASHIMLMVSDRTISRIFIDSKVPALNIREVLDAGGTVYVEVPTQAKSPQARALARMIMMELQILSADRDAGRANRDVIVSVLVDEFGSLVYNDFRNFIDKARSGRFMITLAHQSLGNLSESHLHDSFRPVILDNTANKIVLSLNDVETQEYFARVLGEVEVLRRSATESKGKSSGGGAGAMFGRSNDSISSGYAEVRETVLSASDLATPKGFGYVRQLDESEDSVRFACSLGYVDGRDPSMPSLEEAMKFIREESKMFRPDELPYFKINPTDGRLIDPVLGRSVVVGNHILVNNKIRGIKETPSETKPTLPSGKAAPTDSGRVAAPKATLSQPPEPSSEKKEEATKEAEAPSVDPLPEAEAPLPQDGEVEDGSFSSDWVPPSDEDMSPEQAPPERFEDIVDSPRMPQEGAPLRRAPKPKPADKQGRGTQPPKETT